MEGIQDNYTLAQPGVQSKIIALQDLIQRIDGIIFLHFARHKSLKTSFLLLLL